MTFMEFIKKFPNEKACIDYYVKIRYPNGVHCHHCGSPKVYQRKKEPKVFDCNSCLDAFSPFKGTIFEHSSTDLRKWFYAIHLFLNGKKGISALQLQREIGVTYKTAWRMLQQIRLAMGNATSKEFFDTIVEMDETYVGGKPRKKNNHDDDTPATSGRGTSKTPVVGVVDRLNKIVHAKVAMPNADGKKLTFKQLVNILGEVAKPGNRNTIITDEYTSYKPLERHKYYHFRVDHQFMYSDGKGIHTNTIESFWATLKRGVYGIYHHISIEYMQRYIDEFCFRYNYRQHNMFDLVLGQAVI